jgi:hypothetical protein
VTTFDALTLSRGWLSVTIASGSDPAHLVLNKTVSLEMFTHGARLVATDSYMLLHAWVPALDADMEPEPGWDEAPDAAYVVTDQDSRGRNLMAYLYGLATAKDAPRYEMTLNPTKIFVGDGQGMFDGLAPMGIAVEFPGVEKVTLGVVDATYPDWRKTLAGFTAAKTEAVAFQPKLVARLTKLGPLHGNNPLLWRFGGSDRMALLAVADSDPHVGGAVMPVRWDFDRSMPADDVPAAEPEATE